MKIGNTSQALVRVPNFFIDRSNRSIDTFHIAQRKRLFRENDLFAMTKDINVNNNRRKIKITNESPKNKTISNEYYDINSNKTTQTKTVEEFIKNTDSHKFLHPFLREEIKGNMSNLIERINSNIDLKKWSEMDTRATFNFLHTETLSPLTVYSPVIETESAKFRRTLNEKVSSLSLTSPKVIENIVMKSIYNHQEPEICEKYDDIIKSKGVILNKEIKSNDGNPNVSRFSHESFFRTGLYKGYTSPTRKDVVFLKGNDFMRRRKRKGDDEGLISKEKFGIKKSGVFDCSGELWLRPLHRDHFK